MKYLVVANPKTTQKVAQTKEESELLDILFDLVQGVRKGEICAESYDKALKKLIEAERMIVCPIVGEVTA